jgi:hypothetical protein
VRTTTISWQFVVVVVVFLYTLIRIFEKEGRKKNAALKEREKERERP